MTRSRHRMVVALGAALVWMVASAAAQAQNSRPDPASSAMGQLQNATSGTQSTGQTFDGGNTPTDAYPSH